MFKKKTKKDQGVLFADEEPSQTLKPNLEAQDQHPRPSQQT